MIRNYSFTRKQEERDEKEKKKRKKGKKKKKEKKTDSKVSFYGKSLADWGTYVYSNMELRRTEFRMVMVITEGQSALKMIFVRGITVLL